MESMRLRQVTEISPIGGKVEEGARWPGMEMGEILLGNQFPPVAACLL